MFALGISYTRLQVLRHSKDCVLLSFDQPGVIELSLNNRVVGGMLADPSVVPIAL